jgi:hypothetical protein
MRCPETWGPGLLDKGRKAPLEVADLLKGGQPAAPSGSLCAASTKLPSNRTNSLSSLISDTLLEGSFIDARPRPALLCMVALRGQVSYHNGRLFHQMNTPFADVWSEANLGETT